MVGGWTGEEKHMPHSVLKRDLVPPSLAEEYDALTPNYTYSSSSGDSAVSMVSMGGVKR